MVLSLLIGALSVCGLFLILWTLFDALLMPPSEEDSFHIYRLRGDASAVQQLVKACLRVREHRGMRGSLLFVDDGLDAEAQIAVAMLLRGQTGAYLCAKSQIGDFLQWERENVGAGTD